ncbi:MAG TPA: hypothetical protein VKS60_20515 [Stellaceae bacterium]|nr:hypothetical protein [Stellaceae bacterium]
MFLRSSIALTAASTILLVGSTASAGLPSFGHYAASLMPTTETPSTTGACNGYPATGTTIAGEFAFNTVVNAPAQFLRFVDPTDSQTVIRLNFVRTSGTRRNQTGTVEVATYSFGSSSNPTKVGPFPYTAVLQDYDPNSFGGTFDITYPSLPSSGVSGTCEILFNVAFVRTSAD